MRQTIILLLAMATVAGAQTIGTAGNTWSVDEIHVTPPASGTTCYVYWDNRIDTTRFKPGTIYGGPYCPKDTLVNSREWEQMVQPIIRYPTPPMPPQYQPQAQDIYREYITIADIKAWIKYCHDDSTIAYGKIECPHRHKKLVHGWDRWDCVMDGDSCVYHFGKIITHKNPKDIQGFVDWWERKP